MTARLSACYVAQEARQLGFTQVRRPAGFRGYNFMTDRIVGYFRKGGLDVELSLGEFMGDNLCGVTVMRGFTHKYDLSGCVFTLDELKAKLEAVA